jgi:PleD family two-component response regulator
MDEATKVAEKIRNASENITWDFTKNAITLSVGVSNHAPEQIEGAVDFGVSISLADKALYYSKEHGRNQVTKSSELLDN